MNRMLHTAMLSLGMLAITVHPTPAAPLVEMDFNNQEGYQSLVNRGSISSTGTFSAGLSFNTDVPPPNTALVPDGLSAGGFAGGTGSDAVTLSGVAGLTFTQLTLTAWVKPTNYLNIQYLGGTRTGSLSESGFHLQWESGVASTTDSDFSLHINNGSAELFSTAGLSTPAGTWQFIAQPGTGAAAGPAT